MRSREGEVIGGLFFGHSVPGMFDLTAARIAENLASQAAVALDNSRLYQKILADRTVLLRSEERYRSLVEAHPTRHAVGTTNPEGYVTEDSHSWRELTGQTLAQMFGRGWLEAIHPEFRDEAERALDLAIKDRKIYEFEYLLRMADGHYRWFATKAVPVFEEDGSIREWVGTSTDIDQRRSTEEHLRFLAHANQMFASSLDYEATLRNLTSVAVPTLADWCAVDLISPTAPQGYERLAIAHKDPEKVALAWSLHRNYPPDPDIDPVTQVLRSGESQLLRESPDDLLRRVARDETHYKLLSDLGIVSWMLVALPGRRGPLGAMMFVSSDSKRIFTEMDVVHAEEFARQAAITIENARLYKAAQEANRAKDDFLAMLSHELRTPMTAILGWARILEEGAVDSAEQVMAIDAILRSAKAQSVLIEDILDMSRIISGKMRIIPREVDIIAIVSEAVRIVIPAAEARSLDLRFEHDTGTSLVNGDPDRLQQAIWNLLTNAIKFTQKGGAVSVLVENGPIDVRISVRDTGKGIAPDFLPHVFEPFRQAEDLTTRVHGGLGLGLPIVKQLVELHGGRVAAESEGEGRGATFTIELPAAQSRKFRV